MHGEAKDDSRMHQARALALESGLMHIVYEIYVVDDRDQPERLVIQK
jgi:hypothetical protein